MRKYREDLEEQLILKRRNEWLIIGGDFNITRNRKRNSIRDSLQCDWEHCGRLSKTKSRIKSSSTDGSQRENSGIRLLQVRGILQ